MFTQRSGGPGFRTSPGFTPTTCHPIPHPIYCTDGTVLAGLGGTRWHGFTLVGRFLVSSHGTWASPSAALSSSFSASGSNSRELRHRWPGASPSRPDSKRSASSRATTAPTRRPYGPPRTRALHHATPTTRSAASAQQSSTPASPSASPCIRQPGPEQETMTWDYQVEGSRRPRTLNIGGSTATTVSLVVEAAS